MTIESEFKEDIDKLIDYLASKSVEYKPSPFETIEQRKKRLKAKYEEKIMKQRQHIRSGYEIIIEKFKQSNIHNVDFFLDHYEMTEKRVKTATEKIKKIKERYGERELTIEEQAKFPTGRDIFAYDETTMHLFWEIAAQLMEEKEFEKSANAFIFLTFLDPWIKEYFLGAAIAFENLENLQNALIYYTSAFVLAPESIESYSHLCRCLLKLGENKRARQIVHIAIETSENIDDLNARKEFLAQAKNLQQQLEQRIDK